MTTAGFFGKIPTRGDFVRHGLPADTVAALDAWWQRVIPESRALLGEADWTAAWMQAPVWHFALAPGCCGARPLAGVWVPSTDSAGRLFPLLIALAGRARNDLDAAAGFLAAAEAAAMRVLAEDVGPAELADAVASAAAAAPGASIEPAPAGASRWWTRGSPLVAPTGFCVAGLPDGCRFATMLTDRTGG